jgi:AraC-like DNA-binding protein
VLIDVFLRGIAIGGLLAAGIAMLRGRRMSKVKWTGALFCLATCGFVIHTNPELRALTGPVATIAWIFSAGGTAYFWLFAKAMFSDAPLRAFDAAPPVVMTLIVIAGRLLPDGAQVGTDIAHNMLEIALVAHVLITIWRAREGDLVEARKSFRIPYLAGLGAFCLILSVFDIAWSLGVQDPWIKPAQAAALACMVLAGSWSLLEGRAALFDRRGPEEQADLRLRKTPLVADDGGLKLLEALMADESYWRHPNLTVGVVADRLQIPEYRLRRLINQRLGYQNFPEFINALRIEIAKRELRDAARASDQISTIAFDLGYASLGPFNRAFRAATGMAPSEWRRTGADS